MPATTVAETAFSDLLSHELRWARTIRALVPAAFALSAIQYPIAWALLALALLPSGPTAALFALAWTARALAARGIDRALSLPPSSPALLPLRDLLSLALVPAAFAGSRVRWRGALLDFPAR